MKTRDADTAGKNVIKSPIHYQNIQEITELYLGGEETPSSVVEHFLERIESLDSTHLSYATVMVDQALEQAEILSKELGDGKIRGPLHGIPVAVKDLCYTKGVRTMGGTAVLEENIPDYDSTVVSRLKAAGAVNLGKLNLTEGAMGGYNPKRSIPKNPWDTDKWTGSSSSGSGVATALGLCTGSLGSDTGGSIRFPSSACGLVGIKPTYGRVSRFGVLDLAQTLDHVGPMMRDVRDAALILAVISGFDENDLTTVPNIAPTFNDIENTNLDGVTIGYSENYSEDGVDGEIIKATRNVLEILQYHGATIKNIELDDIDSFLPAWKTLCTAEALNAHSSFFPERASEYGLWFKGWLEHGLSVTSQEYIDASRQRALCNGKLRKSFVGIDAMVSPTVIRPPHYVDDSISYGPMDDRRGTSFQRFTVPFDYNGYPTVSVPSGLNKDGLPLSIQVSGHHLSEPMLCRIARTYEKSLGLTNFHPDL